MEETTQAASSTAVMDSPASIELPASGSDEYAAWRMTGEIPEKAKKVEAPAEKSEATNSGDAADPAASKSGEKPTKRRPDVEFRIKTLTDEIKQLRGQLEESRKTPTKAESSTAQAPRTYEEWRGAFKVKSWTEAYSAQHPNATWEEVQDALSDYKADVREAYRKAEQETSQRFQKVAQSLAEVRKIYADFDTVARPVIHDLLEADGKREIEPFLSRMIQDSPYLPHMMYVIGGSEETRADFAEAVRRDPQKASRLVAMMETAIAEELNRKSSSGNVAPKDSPKEVTPRAVPPPIEIGNRGSGPADESERAMRAIEKGDDNAFANWKRAEDRKELARRKGL